MGMSRILSLCLLLGMASPSFALNGAENVSSACATLEFMAKMVALNLLLPDDADDIGELQAMQNDLAELNRIACQPVLLTVYTRSGSYYKNGKAISRDLYHQTWRFQNDQVFMAQPGEDTTIYYPNGQIMAYHWMHGDQAIFWPNGQLATNYFWSRDVTWYYPDGQIITYEAGLRGGRWFYPFPRLDGRIGQEVISSNWGEDGEDFTFLNFDSNGSLITTRERIRRKLVFNDNDLLDVPGVLLLITRLYQNKDTAKQFAPADVNIAGAPF